MGDAIEFLHRITQQIFQREDLIEKDFLFRLWCLFLLFQLKKNQKINIEEVVGPVEKNLTQQRVFFQKLERKSVVDKCEFANRVIFAYGNGKKFIPKMGVFFHIFEKFAHSFRNSIHKNEILREKKNKPGAVPYAPGLLAEAVLRRSVSIFAKIWNRTRILWMKSIFL